MQFVNAPNGAKLAGAFLSLWSGYYLYKIWKSYAFFKKLGVKTPRPRFIFGNHLEIMRRTHSVALRNWTTTHGKTYGYYEGHVPILVTSDLEFIQEVFIRQHANFVARKEFSFQFSDDSPSTNLFLSTGTRWKRMRNIINPTFSTAKLKELLPIMTNCSERLEKLIQSNAGKEISISEIFNRYTMDVICCCSFGVDLDCLNNPRNRFYVNGLKYFKNLEDFTLVTILATYFNELRPYLLHVMSVSTFVMGIFQHLPILRRFVDPLLWLVQNIDQIIDQRIRNKTVRKDLIQVLLQSQADEIERASSFETVLDKKMNLGEIRWNLVGFLLAGFETTSTALKTCLYLLAIYPDEQRKIQEEIDSYLNNMETSGDPDIESLNSLQYMDMFIKEALRMYPISNNVITRRCTHATFIKDIKIPVGLTVTVDVLSIHYDPEHYGPVDPDQFYPQRFAPECKRNPLAFMGFGAGPRNCVGIKFALADMKLSLIRLLSKFNVRSCDQTPGQLTFTEGIVRRVREDIKIVFENRLPNHK